MNFEKLLSFQVIAIRFYLSTGSQNYIFPRGDFQVPLREEGDSLRKHPFLLALSRRGQNVPIGEERGETDVSAGKEGNNPLSIPNLTHEQLSV